MCGIELPGRGSRFRESPWVSMTRLSNAIAGNIAARTTKPFAFLGHSMGAILSFEVARRLQTLGEATPLHLFVSGAGAPHLRPLSESIYNLPHGAFVDKIREYRGTPPELFDHPELLDLVLPILRADFEACDTYVYQDRAPLECPITAFGGLDDPETEGDRLSLWRQMTGRTAQVHTFPGGHFFFDFAGSDFFEVLTTSLRSVMQRA
jgi:medium-chain acyl-[acyl-carrier-protein] hydrolase